MKSTHPHYTATSGSRESFSFLNAFALALILAFSPVLTSSPLLAQPQTDSTVSASVNINVADARTLAARLSGVGLSKAEAIVRYRETYGPFESIEELADVKGIGQSTVARNRPLITLD